MSERESKYTRPANVLESLGVDVKGLSEEEREMQTLLVEEYKKTQKNLLTSVKKWREAHLKATFGDAIRALFKELDEEK